MTIEAQKAAVEEFWNVASCGEEAFAKGATDQERFQTQADARYQLEPFISDFAKFHEGSGKAVLEIGVGMGADHEQWARHLPAELHGIDLTQRAVDHTTRRLKLAGLRSGLQKADAEHLPFGNQVFDIVYSWGVLHHAPDTQKAFSEVRRVLKADGIARIMIYHKPSIAVLLLWLRYSLLRGKLIVMDEIIADHLESPGTKAFTIHDATMMCRRAGLSNIKTRIQLCSGDLLEGVAGQRHQGRLLTIARAVWPRRLIRSIFPRMGLFLLIEARL